MAHPAEPSQPAQYQAKDAIGETMIGGLTTGGAGLFISTIQNTLTKQNVGLAGVFSRTGGTVATYGRHSRGIQRNTILTICQLQWVLLMASLRVHLQIFGRRTMLGTQHMEE